MINQAEKVSSGATSQFEKVAVGTRILREEAEAILRLSKELPATFTDMVDTILACKGHVIIIGIGKAGWVGQKLSATFASTGTRSFFLHPSEALHGDFGRIHHDDLVLYLSNSGETEELTRLLPIIKPFGVTQAAMTSHPHSTLAKGCDLVLDFGVHREACPLGLAPTTSTTIMLALGDALAMAISHCRSFQPTDFVRFHPGGSLGLKLSVVEEIMRPIDVCRVASDQETVRAIYTKLAGPERRSGAVILTNDSGKLSGLFTDSDLARLLERNQDSSLDRPIHEVMTKKPLTVQEGTLVGEAVKELAGRHLSELPVINHHDQPIGMIDVTDLISLLPKAS